MSYIGNTPTQQNFVAGADQFSGNGSTVAFTLSRSVNTVFDIFVTVSNVPQDPFTAYTVAGNTLTFDGAPPSGTNNIDVVYRATNVQTFVPTPGVSTQLGLGSASAPSLTFIGDTNTGIFSPAADTIAFTEGGVESMRIDSNRNVLVGTTSASTPSTTGFISTANTFGFKNRIINGSMSIWQRATSATITAGSTIAAGYSTVDRFYVYCTGANVTAARVAGSGSTQYRMQITGAASVTAIGIGQRIEQANSYDMAGSTATLSVDLANSVLTTVTWTAFYANTADTFGTLASPTRTQIATGTFTVTSTITNYSTSISIPAAATTGIEIVFTVGAQTSGTWTIGNVQLEKGSTATAFDYRPYSTELQLCQRYYQTSTVFVSGSADTYYGVWAFKVSMRAAPTIAGGAAGFVAATTANTEMWSGYQTTRNFQTLTALIEL